MHVLRPRYRHLKRIIGWTSQSEGFNPASLTFLLQRLVSGGVRILSAHVLSILPSLSCVRYDLYHGRKVVLHSPCKIHLLFLFPPLILLLDDSLESQHS